ncbi:MAG: metallophosphoesterase family protein [Thermodesulfobacteriota bacterium]
MMYFTSDTHFDHFNIIRYCNRPFKTTEEMNEAIIKNWNERIKSNDTVYHLGDFAFAGKERMAEIGARLNGKKYLKMGNHDKGRKRLLGAGFKSIIRPESQTVMSLSGIHVRLSHYPYRYKFEDGQQRDFPAAPEDEGMILLCGHVHEKWKLKNRMLNVGVDVWDFKPVSEDEIIDYIQKNILKGKK